MAANKVTSSAGQRWQRPLTLELLENRWLPSVSGTLAPLAVSFAGDDGEIIAGQQQTRTVEERSFVHHSEQSSSSLSHDTSGDSFEAQTPQRMEQEPSTQNQGTVPATGIGQTAAGSEDDHVAGAPVSPASSEDHAPPATGTGQTATSSEDDRVASGSVSPPSSEDYAPPATGTGQTAASSEDDLGTSAPVSPPSSEDHAPPAAGTGRTPAGSEADHGTSTPVSPPSSEDHATTPATGAGQSSAGSGDDRGPSTTVSHPLSGEGSARGNTHKGTAETGSANDYQTAVTPVISVSPGAGSGATRSDWSGTTTAKTDSPLPMNGVSFSGKDGHPGLSADPPGVMRPASGSSPEGFVTEQSQAGAGSNGGELDKGGVPGEGPAPEMAGLIGEVVPFDLSSLEAGWQNFLGNLHDCVNDLALLSTRGGVVPWIVVAAVTTTAFELARRQLNRPSEEFLFFEAADGRSSGLKHPCAWPQP